MATLTIGMAELIGIVLHSTLYGIYLILFMGCLYVSLGKRRDQRGPRLSGRGTNKFLFTISIILFVLTTSHWIIQILRSADAFIANTSGGSDAYYDNIANPKDVAKTVLYIAQTLVGDLTMIYRLYMVWGRNWKVVVLPSLFTLGFVVVGSAVSASFAGLANGRVVLNTSTVGRLIVAVFTTTLVTNLVVTGLISYRVWSIYRRISAMTQRKMDSPLGHPVVHIILESAGIYTLCLIITLAGYLQQEAYQFIALDATSPIIGIAFSLIIVRVGLGLSTEKSTQWQTATNIHSQPSVAHPIRLGPLVVSATRRADKEDRDVIRFTQSQEGCESAAYDPNDSNRASRAESSKKLSVAR